MSSLSDCLHLTSAPKYRLKVNSPPYVKDQQNRIACNFEGSPVDSIEAAASQTDSSIDSFRGTREFHRIEIESFEMSVNSGSSMSKAKSSASKGDDIRSNASSRSRKESTPSDGESSQLSFQSGNHYVEVTKGILHLLKENKPTPLGEEAERSELICMISVPTSMTTHDILQFTAPVSGDIENLRIIRDSKPNQYMVLIKFRNQKTADEFFGNYNGAQFNTIEPDVCNLVYVGRVETLNESDRRLKQPPNSGLTELPTCAVCLERMDESVEGILTILCNHSFHSNCLDKWPDTSCPVCRYCQTPESIPQSCCFECTAMKSSALDEANNSSDVSTDPVNSSNETTESLWICLVCGHVGCGRYVEGHAYKHYVETQHTYAMQLGNNRVWDYAGDNYVHRLLQNKSDGKVVEVDNASQRASEEKIDAFQLEYTYLLTNQLDTQRKFYEDTIHKIESEAQETISSLQDKNSLFSQEKTKMQEQITNLTKEKASCERKLNNLSSKLTKLTEELAEEKELNKALTKNQDMWQKKLKETEDKMMRLITVKDKELVDLKEQVRDLMFFVQARDKILQEPDSHLQQEIQEGRIVVGEGASTSQPSSSRGKSRKKK